jgi:hypothetical protein
LSKERGLLMKSVFTRARTPLALAIGTLTLVGCGSVPAGTSEAIGRVQGAYSAVPDAGIGAGTGTGVDIFSIAGDKEHAGYDILASNHTGYLLTCTDPTTGQPDATGVKNIELGLGFSSDYLKKLVAQDLGSPTVQTAIVRNLATDPPVAYGDLIPLDCHTLQNQLVEFDLPFDAGAGSGPDHRLFLRLPGDRDPATQLPIVRNVGCAGLLLGLGVNPLNPTVLSTTTLDPNNLDFVDSNIYDINCPAGQAPSGYQPSLFANPSAPQTVSRGQTASVEFTTSENDVVPTSAVLVSTGTNSCIDPATGTSFLKIGVPTNDATGHWGWPVSGMVPGTFTGVSCSASYYLTYTLGGTAFQTLPATFTVNTGCREGTITDCGGCGDVCSAPANAAPVCKTTTTYGPGVCTFTCNSGFASCSGSDCVQMGSLANCGGCGTACPASVPQGKSVCETTAPATWGTCGVACNTGFANCDGDPYNGCEVSPQTDPNNCGSCGNKCPGATACVNGVCGCSPACSNGKTCDPLTNTCRCGKPCPAGTELDEDCACVKVIPVHGGPVTCSRSSGGLCI